jgi:pimeloyl-ACP methyl ester carboxylesterase
MQYFYLHGFLSGPRSKKGEFLASKFQEKGINLIRPDLNDGDFSRMTISSQLAVVEKQLTNSTGPITLIGSSLGAYLAVLLADKFLHIEKLVLIAPAFEFAERFLKTMDSSQLADWKNKGFISLYHYHFQKAVKLGYDIVEDGMKYHGRSIRREIDSIVFHGINDASVPYQLSIEYLKNNSRARLILLNSDHGMLEQLELMWSYIDSFLTTS